jgi:hypothetical protein
VLRKRRAMVTLRGATRMPRVANILEAIDWDLGDWIDRLGLIGIDSLRVID